MTLRRTMDLALCAMLILVPTSLADGGHRDLTDPSTDRTAGGTIAIHQAGSSSLAFSTTQAQTASLSIDEFGDRVVSVFDETGATVLTASFSGLGEALTIDLNVGEAGSYVFGIVGDQPVSFSFAGVPTGVEASITVDAAGGLTINVIDPLQQVVDASLFVPAVGDAAAFSITYVDDPQPDQAERLVPGFPGLDNEESLGGAVALSATGLAAGTVMTVALTYDGDDKPGVEEADLRLTVLDEDTGVYSPAGTNDTGISEPPGALGDYGIDVDRNAAWANVSTLGTFAIGIPQSTLAATIDDDGSGGADMCGGLGIVGLLPMFFVLAGWRSAAVRRRLLN